MFSRRRHLERPQQPVLLDFDKLWNDPAGPVYRWYMKQPSKRFTSLEYRKELNGVFKHEFVVVRLDNGTICRFDRRGPREDRANAPTDKGAISVDTAHILRPEEPYYEETVKRSEVLLRIAFNEPEDLSLILAACCGIKANYRSKVYSLFTYNAYFFCWTLVSIAARCAAKWEEIASSEQQWRSKVVDPSLNAFTKLLGDTLSSTATDAPTRILDKSLIATERKPPDAPGRTPEEIAFRDALQESLLKIRHLAGEELRNLLLRSQLAPVLGKMVRKEVEPALLEFKITVAKDKGISVAMEQVSAARAHSNKPEKFGDLSWRHHCKIACTSAVEAASAAAEAAKTEPENQTWEQEWNEKWEKHWNASMPAQGNTDETKRLEEVVRASAREAWRAEWERAAATGTWYFSAIVETTAECLLDHLHDLPPDRLFLGKRAADNHQGRIRDFFTDGVKYHVTKHLGSNELSLQNYIRSRMQKHCDTVDRYGFGSYDELLQKVEGTMTEIWVATLDNWGVVDMGG